MPPFDVLNVISFSAYCSAKPVTAKCILESATRFRVESEYHAGLVAACKSTPSASYDFKARTWSIDLEHHDELIKKVKGMRPIVNVEPLPRQE